MIDTHCHLDVDRFDRDRDDVLARARAAGVIGMLVPAIRPRTWPALAAIHRATCARGVRIALGIHPQIVPELDADELPRATTGAIAIDDLADTIAAAVAACGAIAVGECGLDAATRDLETQEAIFRAHIRAARAVRRPLVIHALHAHARVLAILREERARDVGGVLHAYSGGTAMIGAYAAQHLAFSFAGPVTYPNARRPIEAARAVPDDLLLVETDAPDQTPHAAGVDPPDRRNEPAFLPAVIAGVAAARRVAPAAIATLTVANARARFASW